MRGGTYDEEDVELVADVLHGNGGDLTDHGVEGKRQHGRRHDTLGAGLGVEDLGGDDPRERSARGAEGEVVGPGGDDEAPRRSLVVVGAGREDGQQDGCDDEGDHVSKVTDDQRPASTEPVDEHHAQELGDERNDGRDGLVLECVVALDAHQAVDSDTVVLNGRYTRHLNRGLERASEEETSERSSVGEEFEDRACCVLFLESDGILNLVELCTYPGIVDIALSVESSQCLETLFGFALQIIGQL